MPELRDKNTAFPPIAPLQCGSKKLHFDKPLIMGIINLTPDSFFEGSRVMGAEEALQVAEQMVGQGADLLDIGAVSTRPGALPVSLNEELGRLLPVLEKVVPRFPQTFFSVDTFRGEVVKQAAARGVHLINDISAGRLDEGMIAETSQCKLPYILMHMQGTPSTMQNQPTYTDVVAEVKQFFTLQMQKLQEQGVSQIVLDPGFGFGKTFGHNYQLLSNLNQLHLPGVPLMVGLSRKSMFYKLMLSQPGEVLPATSAGHMLALLKGANILRAHDVQAAAQVVRVALEYWAYKAG